MCKKFKMQQDEHKGICNKNKIQCVTSEKCSKNNEHAGQCDENKQVVNMFWLNSPLYKKQKLTREVESLVATKYAVQQEKDSLIQEIAVVMETKENIKHEFDEIKESFEKFKLLVDRKKYAKTMLEKTPTSWERINKSSNRTRYLRQDETKTLLGYIHGGDEGAIYGAWDFLRRYASTELMEKFIIDNKRGKFFEHLQGKFTNKLDERMNQAVALKYETFLSRRKYDFICKIQSSTFNTEKQEWSKNTISYGDREINVVKTSISSYLMNNFINNLDIGDVNIIPGFCGATRSVTALPTMIIDLNLRVPSLRSKLIWFNNIENHFVMEFSDDGAPESREMSMSIGTITCWNLGGRVRSREYQYILHAINCSEKADVAASLWKQHSDEMQLIEGNVLNICNERVTVEFQQSADQAWQFWANNELTQSATYPSMFARVHKGQLTFTGGSLGVGHGYTWQVPIMESRQRDLEKLNNFCENLSRSLSEAAHHRKQLEFMANNGLRQVGEPRIGKYCDRQCPELMHLEINNWEHVLNLIYREAMNRGKT